MEVAQDHVKWWTLTNNGVGSCFVLCHGENYSVRV